MTQFTGICTFPHGGFISAGLLLATCAALVATTYSVASCRMVVLSFVSDTGDFEQSFSRFNAVESDAKVEYKVALGLFQWLRPSSDTEWDKGTCVGYQQTMTEAFSEKYLEMSRGAGSVAVLLSVLVVLWSLVSSCIAWNMWQIIILACLLLGGTVATGLCFMIFKSDLCNNTFQLSSCSIDEGGLVLVAGAILWIAAFLITAIFMRTLDARVDDYGLSELERARAREMALTQDKRARDKERVQRQHMEDHQRQLAAVTAISYDEEDAAIAGVTPSTVQSADSYEERGVPQRLLAAGAVGRSRSMEEEEQQVQTTVDDNQDGADEYEVYINTRMQRIDEILQDIQESEDRHEESVNHRGQPRRSRTQAAAASAPNENSYRRYSSEPPQDAYRQREPPQQRSFQQQRTHSSQPLDRHKSYDPAEI